MSVSRQSFIQFCICLTNKATEEAAFILAKRWHIERLMGRIFLDPYNTPLQYFYQSILESVEDAVSLPPARVIQVGRASQRLSTSDCLSDRSWPREITRASIPFRKKALATKRPEAVNLGRPVGQVGRMRIRLEEAVNESRLKIANPRWRFLTRMKNRRFT